MENIRKVSCRIEEYMEYSRNSPKVRAVTSRNHHLSLTMIEVINVPYEWLLYNPTVCWIYFTESTIIRKSGGEFLHITEVIILDRLAFQDRLESQDQ